MSPAAARALGALATCEASAADVDGASLSGCGVLHVVDPDSGDLEQELSCVYGPCFGPAG